MRAMLLLGPLVAAVFATGALATEVPAGAPPAETPAVDALPPAMDALPPAMDAVAPPVAVAPANEPSAVEASPPRAVATETFATQACSNQFSACTGACVQSQPPSMQGTCIENCQNRNSACFARALNPELEREVEAMAHEVEEVEQPPMPQARPARTKQAPKRAPQRSQPRAQRR